MENLMAIGDEDLDNEAGGAIMEVEDDLDEDKVLDPMQSLNDDYTIVYEDDDVAIEDIRSIVSIESAYKNKYIKVIDDYNYYRAFCDALEIENLLKYREDLVVKAIKDFTLKELLIDSVRTGSRS